MKIVNKKIEDIKPYKNNPRINDHAVEAVANSIKEFGFKVPIVIDKNNEIIAGHTRLLASKNLKLKQVPCVIADDLTPEQAKAFRLADNKVAEAALWDEELLAIELEDLSNTIDMSAFGFDLPDFDFVREDDSDDPPEDQGYYGDERERTAEIYNLWEYEENRAAGKYQLPTLSKTDHVPNRLIGFNYVLSTDDPEAGIHFYIDDYQFERLWNNPHKYMERLMEFDCVLTPDFSLYMNMPMAMKIWNVYRSRLLGQLMQDHGITVIPTLQWAEEETFEFCFDGLEQGGTVSVSTIGVKQDQAATQIWNNGMDEAIKRLKPETIVVYGGDIGHDFKKIKTVFIENEVQKRWQNK